MRWDTEDRIVAPNGPDAVRLVLKSARPGVMIGDMNSTTTQPTTPLAETQIIPVISE